MAANINVSRRLRSADRVQSEDLPPPVFGKEEANSVLTLYATPTSPACQKFFTETFDDFDRKCLSGEQAVRFQVIAVAPEMQSKYSRWSMDMQRAVRSLHSKVGVTAGDYAEVACAIQQNVDELAFLEFLKQVCSISDPMDISHERLWELAEKYGLDADEAKNAIEQGTYRPVVQMGTERWVTMIPPSEHFEKAEDAVMFLNGELMDSVDFKAVLRQIRASEKLMMASLGQDSSSTETVDE